jgi:hypothetical protein
LYNQQQPARGNGGRLSTKFLVVQLVAVHKHKEESEKPTTGFFLLGGVEAGDQRSAWRFKNISKPHTQKQKCVYFWPSVWWGKVAAASTGSAGGGEHGMCFHFPLFNFRRPQWAAEIGLVCYLCTITLGQALWFAWFVIEE